MMHPEALAYVKHWINAINSVNDHVLEIGGANINGTVRNIISTERYYAIDIEDAPDVDQIIRARDFDGKCAFDVVVCTEVLEHVEQPAEIIACAWRALRSGGHLILTCASTGRPTHGARGDAAPGAHEWYRNVPIDELRDLLYAWGIVDLNYLQVPGDARCVAVRP